ncbi:unnamed protein product [Pieris brassicae]|uniref:Uncharacterized protein n=1 Tax=Pieris brassicae TaxID=7116 RepID=A0A9P0TCI5_PIEBR|nr:unnamed protein product [Pieris brassicae]
MPGSETLKVKRMTFALCVGEGTDLGMGRGGQRWAGRARLGLRAGDAPTPSQVHGRCASPADMRSTPGQYPIAILAN